MHVNFYILHRSISVLSLMRNVHVLTYQCVYVLHYILTYFYDIKSAMSKFKEDTTIFCSRKTSLIENTYFKNLLRRKSLITTKYSTKCSIN